MNKHVHLHQTSNAPEDRGQVHLMGKDLIPKGQPAPTMLQVVLQPKQLAQCGRLPSNRQDSQVPSTGMAYKSNV